MRVTLRVVAGAGLAVLGLAAIGSWLSPAAEPRGRPSDLAYGPLPPAPEAAPGQVSPAVPAAGEIRSEAVSIPVREEVLGGTVFSPAEAGRHPAIVLVHGAGPGRRSGVVDLAESFARSGIVALE